MGDLGRKSVFSKNLKLIWTLDSTQGSQRLVLCSNHRCLPKAPKTNEQPSPGWTQDAPHSRGHCCHSRVWKHTVRNHYFHFSSSGRPQNATWVGFQLFCPMTLTLTSLRKEEGLSNETSGNWTFKASIFSDRLACPQ